MKRALTALHAGHRIIAVTSVLRSPVLPDAPSFGELWNQSFDTWVGLVAPKGLDNEAYSRLASAASALLGDAAFVSHARAAGVTLTRLDSQGAMAYLDSEILRNAKQIAMLNEDGMR